jgi:hypothetical protein
LLGPHPEAYDRGVATPDDQPEPESRRAHDVERPPWLARLGRSPLAIAAAIYLVVELVLVWSAPAERLREHTPFNHFALLADAWLHGRLDLGGPPPGYTGGNDFAVFDGKYYVSFPPMPAVLLLPLVALSHDVTAVRDGWFFVLLAGLGPAVLYLALEKLSRAGRSLRSSGENVFLAATFAFGTVYWFTAVQGTVWFAAHVVAVIFAAAYLYASIDADHPFLAGLFLGCAFATRAPLLFAIVLFGCELFRRSRKGGWSDPFFGFAPRELLGRGALFAAPLAATLALLAWHNEARFGNPFEFGHRYLAVVWHARIEKWGLFSLHYLGKNLGVMLAAMPFIGAKGTPIRVNAHGLALTLTSPFFAWALWPRRSARAKTRFTHRTLAIAAAIVAIVDLLYQNTGWIQFGYRFSNDFSIFLVAMIAVGRRRLGFVFSLLVGLSILVNAFGALTFQRAGYEKYYYLERTQSVVFEPD